MKKYKNILIFAVCYIAYTSIYVARLNLSMASSGMMSANILTKSQIGLLGSFFSIIYAAGRLLNGGLADRTPPFKMICSGLLLAGVANIAFGFFPPFIGLLLLWSLNAWAQSMLWSSILCVLSELHDEATAKKLTSFMVTSVAAGNIAGIILNTFIISRLGFRFAFILPGALTIIMGALAFIAIGKIPAPKPRESSTKSQPIFSLLKNRELLVTSIPAFLHGVMKDNISLWMAVYFIDSFGVDLESSAYFVLFIPIVGFVGRMIYPLLYKLCRENEHIVTLIGFVICIISCIPLCLGTNSPIAAMLALGFIYAAVSIINTSFLSIYPIHYVNEGRVASVSGIMDFVTYLGAGISSVIYGYIGYLPMFVSWLTVSVISVIILTSIIKRSNS